MQRVTSMLPSWDKTKTSSKKGFDKAYAVVDKLGAPINRLSNKIGSEAFWPTTLDKESDKAARILKSFCKDGFYAEEERPATEGVPKGRQRVLKKIPEKVIQNAVGLAIFTTMRTGLWISGAGGSGILIARQENGEWSPPSGIMLHTAGLGFLVGVDIYDCVVVINNRKALEAFTKIRATLGGEISAVAGPVGVGGVLENDGKWKQANRPVFTYLKSRGLYAGVQVDGTVIIERTDENEKFYGERIGVADILAGKARHPPYEIKLLMETVKAAEGRSDVDRALIQELDDQPAPGDLELEEPNTSGVSFGIPEPDDPDPFGVLALEKAGFEIREAGSKSRPASSQFEFNPSPTSPAFNKFHRRSLDTLGTRSNRDSYMSNRSSRTRTSIDRYATTEIGTQTDDFLSPSTSPTRSTEKIVEEDEKRNFAEPEEVDYTKIDLSALSNLTKNHSEDFDGTTVNESPREEHNGRKDSIDDSYNSDDDDEEPVIFEAASAQATVIKPQAVKARGGLVNIPKRPPPPPLPPRSVARTSRHMVDQASGRSPLRSEFEEVDLHGVDRRSNEVYERHSNDLGSSKSPELPPRKSTSSDKVIQMEDLEKDALATQDSIKEPQNQDESTPTETLLPSASATANESKGEEPVKLESEDVKETLSAKGHRDGQQQDQDEFHSLPTTPNEIQVK